MLELFALNSVKGSNDDPDSPSTGSTVVAILVILIWFAIFFWAVTRALQCSKKDPDSRAIHFLFCLTSPSLYLVCSYAVPDFCNDN